jgi:hypothetical protein
MIANLRSYRRSALALTIGVLAGVALVTVYTFSDSVLTAPAGGDTLLSPTGAAFAALMFSFYYAVIIAVISVPLWYLLARASLAGPRTAALLGFLVTWAYWVASNSPAMMLEAARSGIPYGLCGSVAGLVTWWVSNRRLRPLSTHSRH